MGWQPGQGNGTGEEPVPDAPTGPGAHSGFSLGGEWEACPTGPELAAALAAVAGPEWRCPGAEPDELVGVLRRVAALESWASAAKLGVIRELIRRDDAPVRPATRTVTCPISGAIPSVTNLPSRSRCPRSRRRKRC